MSQAGDQNQSCWLVPSFTAFCAQSRASTSQLPSFRPGLSALPGSATTIHHGQTIRCQRVDYRTKPGPFSSESLPLVPPCPQPFPAVLASLCFLDEDLRRGPPVLKLQRVFSGHIRAHLFMIQPDHILQASAGLPLLKTPKGMCPFRPPCLCPCSPLPCSHGIVPPQVPLTCPSGLSLLEPFPNPPLLSQAHFGSGLRTYLLYGNCCGMPERADAISPLSAVPPGVAAASEDTALPLWASKALSPLSHIERDALGAAHFSASFQL